MELAQYSTARTLPSAPTAPSAEPSRQIPELSAIMPAFNEEAVLTAAIREAVAALDQVSDRWELLMVDDGSDDATPEILDGWAARDPRIRVLRQPRNLGYSKALIRGFRAARYPLVFYTDADAQFDLRQILDLHAAIDGAEMAVGYRQQRQDPGIRLLTSAVYNRLQGWLLGVRVRDVNCAFKLFRREALESLELASDGFLIDAELFARAQRKGFRWNQVGVTHRSRDSGSSSVRVGTVWETLRELWSLRKAL